MFTKFIWMKMKTNKRISPVTITVFLMGILVRFLLIPIRWINPDEGAHLMGGRLIVEGLIPVADYGARQPLYVYALALFNILAGPSYMVGRLLPVISSVGIAMLLYYIAQRLYGVTAAWIAAAIYLFLPLLLIWAPVVKTEQPAIFLVMISMAFVLRMEERPGWMILAGSFAALAFYIRQPTLYAPLAVVLYVLFFLPCPCAAVSMP